MRPRSPKTYDVWFLSDRKHTRMVVYYPGKSLSRLKALALARRLNKKRGHKAVVVPHGKAPPGHAAVPAYAFRVGQRVRTKSYGEGVIEARERNFDWAGADDLYRVRVGHTLHLLGASQLNSIGLHRAATARLARDTRRPPPLPSKDVRTMTAMLKASGYPRPTTSAQALAARGVGPAELAWRLEKEPGVGRSKTRARKAKRRRR